MATDPNAGRSVPLVTRVKNILLTPRTEWPVIDAEPSTIGGIYKSYVMILAAIPAVAFIIGMLLIGANYGYVSYRPSLGFVLATALIQYLIALGSVYVMALIIEALAPTFGGTKNRVSAFKLAAYSYTASWVAGILLILPSLALIAALLGLYSLYLLYVGLPVLMKSPGDKSIGYIVAIVVAAIVVFIIAGAITGAVVGSLMPAPTPGSLQINIPG